MLILVFRFARCCIILAKKKYISYIFAKETVNELMLRVEKKYSLVCWFQSLGKVLRRRYMRRKCREFRKKKIFNFPKVFSFFQISDID
jgi:hypothetical protein